MLKLLLLFALVTLVLADFKQQCLDRHNLYRSRHSAAPLQIDANLQNIAEGWAKEMARTSTFKHSGRFGENIAVYNGRTSINGEAPVDLWYNEVKLYDYNRPGYSDATGHFTQVVWRASNKLGCAQATNGKNVYIVANYLPYGNFPGQFSENVRPN